MAKDNIQSPLIYISIWDKLGNSPVVKRFVAKKPVNFWIWFGLLVFLCSQIFLMLFNEQPYFISQFMILVGVSLLIAIYISWLIPLRNILIEYLKLTKLTEQTQWINNEIENIFTFKNPLSKIVILAVSVSTMVVISYLRLPYSNSTNLIGYACLIPITVVGGHGVYMAFALYHLLFKLSRLEIDEKLAHDFFYRFPPSPIVKIYQYYLTNFSLVMVAAYLWLLIAVISSPYGLNPLFMVFLIVLAFFPFPAFIWTYWCTGIMSLKIRTVCVDYVNEQVRNSLGNARNDPTKENIELLNHWMDLQDKINASSPMSFRIGDLFSGLITSATIVLQVALSLRQLIS